MKAAVVKAAVVKAAVDAVGCPACGGALSIRADLRRQDCPFCGADLLILAPEHLPQWAVPTGLDARAARRRMAAALRDGGADPRAVSAVEAAEVRRFEVPYYELEARVLGLLVLQTGTRRERGGARVERTPEGAVRYFDRADREIGAEAYYARQVITEHDTRVRMFTTTVASPAIQLPGWGLEVVNLAALRRDGVLSLPVDLVRAQAESVVFSPTLPRESVRRKLETAWATSQGEWNASLSEERLQVIYVPVWHARFAVDGRVYTLTVSGADGAVLAGSAPLPPSHGVTAMVLAGACVAFPAVALVRLAPTALELLSTIGSPGGSAVTLLYLLNPATVGVASVVGAGLLIAGSVAWSELRYLGEIQLRGDTVTVVKLGRPAVTQLERTVDGLLGTLNLIFGRVIDVIGPFFSGGPR